MSPTSAYVAVARRLPWHPSTSRSEGRLRRWARSLPAIHDIDRMVALDVPWWTYDAIAEVERHLDARPQARVFEFGSGASTVWLARRAARVVSVEHDALWHPVVARHVDGMSNVELHLVEATRRSQDETGYRSGRRGWEGVSFRDYARSILAQDDLFDLVVVDGRARVDCLRHAVEKLAPGGVVLFDNSGRGRYAQAIEECGLRGREHRGLAPGLPYPEQTTLLRA